MADRFWVGGTASWDATAGTKWATTDGGAGGASVPTSADDVYFTAASGTVTVTVAATGVAKSINFTGFTGTFAGSSGLTVSGSVTLSTGMVVTYTGTVTFNATGTLITAGKTFTSFTIIGAATTFGLGDALTVRPGGSITVTQGTFNTNGYSVAAATLDSTNSNTRAINLGSSTVTLTGSVNFTNSSGLTFSSGTSQINLSSPGIVFNGGGQIFYNVAFTSTSTGGASITGTNTFNNFSVTGPASAGVIQVGFSARQTINGTLSTTGTAGNRRVWFRGETYGLAQTLTINSTPSLTDADFRDIYVVGTAAPISGTRIGDLRGIRGITASTPKTVYWNLAAGGNWSANAWATTSGGAVSTDNFPLAQDTAVIGNTGLNTSATVTVDSVVNQIMSGVDMSGRTNAMTFALASGTDCYGDWKNGTGTTLSGGVGITFSGRNTQTITSAGKVFSGSFNVSSYGGTVQLADALNLGSNTLFVTNGTFNTQNYNVTAGSLSSVNTNVRTINLGSSTVTLSGTTVVAFGDTTTPSSRFLTFNAGTSTIVCSSTSTDNDIRGNVTFYNLTVAAKSAANRTFTVYGNNVVFNNLTVLPPTVSGTHLINFARVPSSDTVHTITVQGTFTCQGSSLINRIAVRNNNPHITTNKTLLYVNTLVASNCDFQSIQLMGAASPATLSGAGDLGNNANIVFPSPKTVYWNLAGSTTWFDTGWAATSGGAPSLSNFPLAQDTAVFDNSGSAGTVTYAVPIWVGTLDVSARSTAMTLNFNSTFNVCKDLLLSSAVSYTGTSQINIMSSGVVNYISCNGATLSQQVTINNVLSKIELSSAFSSTRNLVIPYGSFDAKTYNVTVDAVNIGSNVAGSTIKMGSGLWTITGNSSGSQSSQWLLTLAAASFYKGSADILFSSVGTSARTFAGNGLTYNKLTIGGTTGTSTTTITGNNQFTELASTKTVAHTIDLGTTTQTFGAWTVTGTAGNVVTVTGTAALTIAGARVSGVDYLAMGTTTVSATSPGEFYSGANSTGTGTGIIKTAAPTPVTRYWRGGTGTWNATTTTNWSDTSGGSGGFSVPTSADAVVFDTLSNATAYTVTCTATQLRCGSLTMAGPLTGNVTWAGTAPLAIHDNVTLPATGLTRTYTGNITLSGSTTGKTFTTNGVEQGSSITVNGVACGWSFGSAVSSPSNFLAVTNGALSFASYSHLFSELRASNNNTRVLDFSTATVLINSTPAIDFGTTETARANLTVTAGSSQINCSATSATINGNNQTFYNVAFTSTTPSQHTISGDNTYNNLSFGGSARLTPVSFSGNQIINGTLTVSATTNATFRLFFTSDAIGTTRTLTCAAVASLTDIDFRDITIAGAAAPVSGTRLGDCKGNSGITFDAAKTVYYRATGTANWGANTSSWSLTSGGTADHAAFPLAQDTAIFPSATYPASGSTVSMNAAYNIGTIDMSARTSNTMTLATGITIPFIYGNWINGTGITLTGAGSLAFAGRGSQTITSAGVAFAQALTINNPNGSVTLQDALNLPANNMLLTAGTFEANSYNVTLGNINNNSTSVRTLGIGSGTWTASSSGSVWTTNSINLTVTGTGTISLTSASAKTFAGGDISYSGITLNQGGAGTLTITGNNTFANISNTYKATGATTIAMGTTTQTVGNFTASGEVGRVLTVQGSSASSPATLVLTSGTVTTPDYLAVTGVRAYSLVDTWYAGANSTNNGSLGWYFSTGIAPTSSIYYGATNVTVIYYGSTPVSAIYYGSTQVF